MHVSKETNHAIQLYPASTLARIIGESCLKRMIEIQRSMAFDRVKAEIGAELAGRRREREREQDTLQFLDDLARHVGLGSDWRETYEAALARQREHKRTRPLAQLPPDYYEYLPDPPGFLKWARHRRRGGRRRNERYMDRRGYVLNPELQSSNNDVRTAGWATLGPFRTPIYPVRVTEADLLLREKAERQCCVCGATLASKRLDAIYCSDKCRKRDVRANGPRSL